MSNSSSKRRGLYRVETPPSIEDYAQVIDENEGVENAVDESLYRARGYKPPFETLPTRDDYFAPKRPKDMNQAAKRIVDIATGEEQNDSPKD